MTDKPLDCGSIAPGEVWFVVDRDGYAEHRRSERDAHETAERWNDPDHIDSRKPYTVHRYVRHTESGSHAEADTADVVWQAWVMGLQTLCSNLRFRHKREMWKCLGHTIGQCEEHYQTLLQLRPPRAMECRSVALDGRTRQLLKTWPAHFAAVAMGAKTFEARTDDRGFAVGHLLDLAEYDPDKGASSGQVVTVEVTHLLRGPAFGIEEGHVVMSVQLVQAAEQESVGRDGGGS